MAIGVLGAVALVAVTALAVGHSPAQRGVVLVPRSPVAVSCGETISSSIVVGNDLTCASGNGLAVAADGITVNLNGHTLAGNPGGLGVHNSYRGVTIENGTVTGWGTGIFELLGAS
ncbi:MAG: hypothetical protein JO075_12815, partial [Acidimicrobiia bacterium]|nr:hypothetical protein [Acidimicrobiia bacterium]